MHSRRTRSNPLDVTTSDAPALPVLPEGQLSWALQACVRVMRPLVKLALAMGLKHAHLDHVLRELLLQEAQRLLTSDKGAAPNVSQLSMTTGLNRKAITSRMRLPQEPPFHRKTSAAARVLTLWLQMATIDPALQSLPIMASGDDAASFEGIARRASHGNVHHRAVLDELVRLDMAREQEGRASLNTNAFVPSNDLRGMLGFVGDNTGDHLAAAVSNTLGMQPALLERSVFAGGISTADCERLHQLTRERWQGLHHELAQEMTRAYEAAGETDTARIRVGIYTYYEDTPAVSAAEPASAHPQQRSRRKA